LDNTARAVVRVIADSPSGLTIIERDRLHEILKT
jgi:hypothetical protein